MTDQVTKARPADMRGASVTAKTVRRHQRTESRNNVVIFSVQMSVFPVLESSPWMTNNTFLSLKPRKYQTVQQHMVNVRIFFMDFLFR